METLQANLRQPSGRQKSLGTDADDLTGLDEFQMIEASWHKRAPWQSWPRK